MTAREIIHSLEQIGYTLTVIDGKVRGDRQDLLPPPPEAPALLERLREHKGEVLDILLYRGFTEVPPSSGDRHTITFEGECTLKRWSVAVHHGLIHLTDKLQLQRSTGRYRISFRCNQPLEWLDDEITATCKREYARTLERIQNGEAWLKANEDSPEYERAYAGFLALQEDLRLLYAAIGETMDSPSCNDNAYK